MISFYSLTRYFLIISFSIILFACGEVNDGFNNSKINILEAIQEYEKYTTKDSVAAYIHKFKKLPSNYVNKSTGQSMYEEKGYNFSAWNFNPLQVLGIMIGGDEFCVKCEDDEFLAGNYFECDVDYHASNRGTKRLVYTYTGIVYYTADHYETFTLIYEE